MVDAVLARRLSLSLIAHYVLSYIEQDPDGFLLRNLPAVLRDFLRHHGKAPMDAPVDFAARRLLPIVQPRHLRCIGSDIIEVAPDVCLEVFRPAVGTPPAPVLLFVHGGVWTLGNRSQYRALGQRLALEGVVGVIVGYQTWPAANASAQARSIRVALAEAKLRESTWGGDPSRVYLSGQSSGANVSALALVGNASGGGVHCAGFIGMAGPYDIADHYAFESRRGVEKASMMELACDPFAEHSPTLLVRERGATLTCERTLLLHGEKDVTVPASSSAHFALALLAAGQQVTYVSLPTDTHMSFLLDMMLGRECALLSHVKKFCDVRTGVAAARL